MMNFRMRPLAVVVAIAAAAPLSACTATTSVERGAEYKGVEYCIVNDSSMRLNVQWRGFPAPIDIPFGATQCNSGQQPTIPLFFWGNDMDGTLGYEPPAYPGSFLHLDVWGNNRLAMPPVAGASFVSEKKDYGICAEFDEQQTKSMETDWLHADLTRLPDTEHNKKFELRITDSNKNYHADKCSQ